MSSDETSSTDASNFSNLNDPTRQLNGNVKKPEEWEIDTIGNFLLQLYHRLIITHKNDWCVEKSRMRKEYLQFLSAEERKKLRDGSGGGDNIGGLLHRCGFLINTMHGSSFYKIKYLPLFEFRNKKLKQMDNLKMNNDKTTPKQTDESFLTIKNHSIVLEDDQLEVDENEEKIPLEYQGTTIQRRVKNFCPSNMSCYICQKDFSTMETFEEHIQTHGDETDFEFLKSLTEFASPICTMSYRLCQNSHNFCFEIETNLEDLIIEKIIIVQSRSFFYVLNKRVPFKCPADGKQRFFVDSHLFTIHLEQPVILICHLEDSKESRIIEQYHFMRSEEFPKVTFAINPNSLPSNKQFETKLKLANYFPAKEIEVALKDASYHEKLMQTSYEFRDYVRNGKNLQASTMGKSLNILLQIEDMDTMKEYVGLKQKKIQLRSYGDEFSFQLTPNQRVYVENLLSPFDELVLTTRSSVFNSEHEIMQLMLTNSSQIKKMDNTFVGLIQAINAGRISFKCEQKKEINLQDSYTVIFRPSRLNLRYQYRSLQLLPVNMYFLKKFLFPTQIESKPLSSISLNLYNENINPEQLQAVRNIAEGPRNDATYIIFGPPGTGKTTTVVESILQVLKKPDTKILVTASSNSACDEVALRLSKHLKTLDIKRAMVRIYSRSYEVRMDTIDDELLENSNMYNGQFYPDINVLHEYRIVVCTLSVVAKLAMGRFGRKENGAMLYTHLFIDEVAASMETEALLAITTILTPDSCLIISGDQKQLGPVIKSKRAKELGLETSLMERLLKRDCYRVDIDTGNYNRTIQTRLVRNYRSHSAIVNLFSGLFYDNSLQALAKEDDVSLCKLWHKSRSMQYPILFHAIHEPSKCDKRSHSLYNLTELHVVMDYIKDLMYFGINGVPVKESDIGIISPYKRQYKRIQEELNLRKWFNIETGSVETFQGKEKDIIIVSFVRSGTEHLGFLDCPRRLNVTISRAKSLLILIGNPKTLSLNSNFEFIIKECQRNDTFIGSNGQRLTENFVGSQEKLSQLNKKMQSLSVENSEQEKKPSKNRDRRRRGRRGGKGRRKSKSTNNQDTYVNTNSDDEDESESDDDDDDLDAYLSIRKNIEKSSDMETLKKNRAANGGKISKQYVKSGPKNHTDGNINKIKIDTLFNELPKVPTASASATYTRDQLLQIQHQQQYYQNQQQQQNQQLYPPHNNPYFNSAIFSFNSCQTAPNLVPFAHPLNYPSSHNRVDKQVWTNSTNLSCFRNPPNTNIPSLTSLVFHQRNTNLTKRDTSTQNDKIEVNSRMKNNNSHSNTTARKDTPPPKFSANMQAILSNNYNSNDGNNNNSPKPAAFTAVDVTKNSHSASVTNPSKVSTKVANNTVNKLSSASSSNSIRPCSSTTTAGATSGASTKVANKTPEKLKIVYESSAGNVVAKDKPSINSGSSATTYKFSTNSDNKNNFSASSSNAIRPSGLTTTNNSPYSQTCSNVNSNSNFATTTSGASSNVANKTVEQSKKSSITSGSTTTANRFSTNFGNNVNLSASSSNAIRRSVLSTTNNSPYSQTCSNVNSNSKFANTTSGASSNVANKTVEQSKKSSITSGSTTTANGFSTNSGNNVNLSASSSNTIRPSRSITTNNSFYSHSYASANSSSDVTNPSHLYLGSLNSSTNSYNSSRGSTTTRKSEKSSCVIS